MTEDEPNTAPLIGCKDGLSEYALRALVETIVSHRGQRCGDVREAAADELYGHDLIHSPSRDEGLFLTEAGAALRNRVLRALDDDDARVRGCRVFVAEGANGFHVGFDAPSAANPKCGTSPRAAGATQDFSPASISTLIGATRQSEDGRPAGMRISYPGDAGDEIVLLELRGAGLINSAGWLTNSGVAARDLLICASLDAEHAANARLAAGIAWIEERYLGVVPEGDESGAFDGWAVIDSDHDVLASGATIADALEEVQEKAGQE